MDSDKPTLLDMPPRAMNLILDKAEYYTKASLRKVCRSLRNFIQENPPNSRLSQIECNLFDRDIVLRMTPADNSQDAFSISYTQFSTFCHINFLNEGFGIAQLDDVNIFDIAFNVLEMILDNQTSVVDELVIKCGNLGTVVFHHNVEHFHERLEACLVNREQSVRTLSMRTLSITMPVRTLSITMPPDEARLMTVLPHLHPFEIHTLEIVSVDREAPRETLELAQVFNTPQWASLQCLVVDDKFWHHSGSLSTSPRKWLSFIRTRRLRSQSDHSESSRFPLVRFGPQYRLLSFKN